MSDVSKKILQLKVLLDISEESGLMSFMNKKLLIEEYETWRGNAAQLDDLLVIGMRVDPQRMVPLNGAPKVADVVTAEGKN